MIEEEPPILKLEKNRINLSSEVLYKINLCGSSLDHNNEVQNRG